MASGSSTAAVSGSASVARRKPVGTGTSWDSVSSSIMGRPFSSTSQARMTQRTWRIWVPPFTMLVKAWFCFLDTCTEPTYSQGYMPGSAVLKSLASSSPKK